VRVVLCVWRIQPRRRLSSENVVSPLSSCTASLVPPFSFRSRCPPIRTSLMNANARVSGRTLIRAALRRLWFEPPCVCPDVVSRRRSPLGGHGRLGPRVPADRGHEVQKGCRGASEPDENPPHALRVLPPRRRVRRRPRARHRASSWTRTPRRSRRSPSSASRAPRSRRATRPRRRSSRSG
jgi:hypothetical protein